MIVSENISIGATADYNVLFAHVDPDLKDLWVSLEAESLIVSGRA